VPPEEAGGSFFLGSGAGLRGCGLGILGWLGFTGTGPGPVGSVGPVFGWGVAGWGWEAPSCWGSRRWRAGRWGSEEGGSRVERMEGVVVEVEMEGERERRRRREGRVAGRCILVLGWGR